MTPSAHLDTFARDNLPPRAQWPDFLFGLPELEYPDRVNCVVELLDRRVASGDGHRPCVISPNETLTYAQMAERVNRIANALTRELDVVPGNRVLLRGPNNPMMVAATLAVIKAGGVVVATMPLLRAKEIVYPIAKAKIRLALCDVRLAEEMEKARTQAGDLERVIYWGSDASDALDALMAKPGYETFTACDTACDDVRPAGDLRQLRPSRAARASHRPLHRFAAARLYIRPRRPRAVSVAHRRLDHSAGKGRAGRSARRHGQAPRDHLIHRAHGLSRDACKARRARRLVAAQMRVRRRSLAEVDVRRLARRDRHQDPRRHRRDRDAAHLHRLTRERDPAGLNG